MPKKTQKSRKVAKATDMSNKRLLEYASRLRTRNTRANEFPASVDKVLGGGRFRVKNLLNKEELVVSLSKSLYVDKRSTHNPRTEVAIHVGDIVLVADSDQITAKIDRAWFSILKMYWELPESNDLFESPSNNNKTRKQRKESKN
jgi:translation initiation factor IF-1